MEALLLQTKLYTPPPRPDLVARSRSADAHYGWACLEANSGNMDAALDHLSKSLAENLTQREWAKRDPDLESLHGHPRFETLVGNEAAEGDT